ncbi:MAG: hypothetical protein K5682_08685 [Lachnospiraceae bacterium]|nr:hypothetical protein [Lachnospiraceae bacterium]
MKEIDAHIRFQKLIPKFLADELNYKNLTAFVKHVRTCPECMEELTIQYLVGEGINRLEEGESFDLHEGLEEKLEAADDRLLLHRIMQTLIITAEALGVAAVVIIAVMVFVL